MLCSDIGCVVVNNAELLYPDQMETIKKWANLYKFHHLADVQVRSKNEIKIVYKNLYWQRCIAVQI